jgi:aspartate carbamoyltransferase catalytic subunit
VRSGYSAALMTDSAVAADLIADRLVPFPKAHFLAAADLNPPAAAALIWPMHSWT